MKTICPFTQQEIKPKNSRYDNSSIRYYKLIINNEEKQIGFDEILYKNILEKNVHYPNLQIQNQFNEIKTFLFFEYLNPTSKVVNGSVFYWDETGIVSKPNKDVVIMNIIKKLKENKDYPQTSRQKGDYFLTYIYDNQKQGGDKVTLIDDPSFWGKLFFQNFAELLFYVEELVHEGYLRFDKENINITLSLHGLERVENSRKQC